MRARLCLLMTLALPLALLAPAGIPPAGAAPDGTIAYTGTDGNIWLTQADGTGKMKELLGGKGAGLAEMTSLGLPVPPGFTITTEACTFHNARRLATPPLWRKRSDSPSSLASPPRPLRRPRRRTPMRRE